VVDPFCSAPHPSPRLLSDVVGPALHSTSYLDEAQTSLTPSGADYLQHLGGLLQLARPRPNRVPRHHPAHVPTAEYASISCARPEESDEEIGLGQSA
jgi:hypothetical protein